MSIAARFEVAGGRLTTRTQAGHRQKALPVIHEQLAKAAVRLAGVLNRALR